FKLKRGAEVVAVKVSTGFIFTFLTFAFDSLSSVSSLLCFVGDTSLGFVPFVSSFSCFSFFPESVFILIYFYFNLNFFFFYVFFFLDFFHFFLVFFFFFFFLYFFFF